MNHHPHWAAYVHTNSHMCVGDNKKDTIENERTHNNASNSDSHRTECRVSNATRSHCRGPRANGAHLCSRNNNKNCINMHARTHTQKHRYSTLRAAYKSTELTQHEHDARVSFTYILAAVWPRPHMYTNIMYTYARHHTTYMHIHTRRKCGGVHRAGRL